MEEAGNNEHEGEAHHAVGDVAIGQLHLHALPGSPHVALRDAEDFTRQRNRGFLHGHFGQQENDDPDQQAQYGLPKDSHGEGGQGQGQAVGRRVQLQTQHVVDVRAAGHAGAAAQDLSCVPSRRAPRVQGEREDAQGQVETDDNKGCVFVS